MCGIIYSEQNKEDKNMEEKIVKALMNRGLSRAEASRDAFLYIEAWRKGEVEPETMRALGIEIDREED